MTIHELKAQAAELGLTPDEVRQYGSLSKKATWERAIKQAESTIKEDEQTETETCPACDGTGIFQPDNDACYACDGKGFTDYDDVEETCPLCEGSGIHKPSDNTCGGCHGTGVIPLLEELPFEPIHTLIDGKWVEIEGEPVSNSVTAIQSFPILPFTFTPTKPCKPDNAGYLVWDEKLRNWVKEKPSESSTPYRDKLIAKMSGYVDKGVTLSALEDMQKNPPDEQTAAIYLGLLEESERMLKEAVA